MTDKPGACDPLVEAREEIVALLESLGVAAPERAVRTVFDRLRRRYAGERPYIAHVERDERDEQRRLILESIAAGSSVRSVAKQMGLPPSTVWRVKKEWAF